LGGAQPACAPPPPPPAYETRCPSTWHRAGSDGYHSPHDCRVTGGSARFGRERDRGRGRGQRRSGSPTGFARRWEGHVLCPIRSFPSSIVVGPARPCAWVREKRESRRVWHRTFWPPPPPLPPPPRRRRSEWRDS
jgi:hypothetical protein